MSIEQEIRNEIDNIKQLKIDVGDINNHLSILEGLCGERNQKAVDDAYQRGYKACMQENDFDSPCTSCEAYQRGLEDGQNEIWEATKKVAFCSDEGGLSVEELEEIFGCFTVQQIFRKHSAQQTIEKLKAYEEKQKANDEIKVGDEVIWTQDENVAIVVTRVYTVDGYEWCDGICRDGKVYYILTKNVRKTGRHFDIDKILEEMKK